MDLQIAVSVMMHSRLNYSISPSARVTFSGVSRSLQLGSSYWARPHALRQLPSRQDAAPIARTRQRVCPGLGRQHSPPVVARRGVEAVPAAVASGGTDVSGVPAYPTLTQTSPGGNQIGVWIARLPVAPLLACQFDTPPGPFCSRPPAADLSLCVRCPQRP